MGAHSDIMLISGRKSESEALAEFRKRARRLHKLELQLEKMGEFCGASDGYGWASLDNPYFKVRFEDKVFDNLCEGENYCLERAEKWEYGYAVKVKCLAPGKKKKGTYWMISVWVPE